MAAKLNRLIHKIATQLHLVAESCLTLLLATELCEIKIRERRMGKYRTSPTMQVNFHSSSFVPRFIRVSGTNHYKTAELENPPKLHGHPVCYQH